MTSPPSAYPRLTDDDLDELFASWCEWACHEDIERLVTEVRTLRSAIREHRARRTALKPSAQELAPGTGDWLPLIHDPKLAAAHERADERLWSALGGGE